MNVEGTARHLQEELVLARARIAELETALARHTAPNPPPAPSFILESITDAFVAFDAQYRYIWVNAEAERLLRLPRERILGQSIWELFPATIGSPLEHNCRQALAETTTQELEYFYAPWERWFQNKIYPTSEGGLAIYWRDITEQKRLLADLRRQASVLAQVRDSIIITDLEGVITSCNRGASQIFGYEHNELVGQHVSILYFEEDARDVPSRILEPLLLDGSSQVELRNRRKTGEECFVTLSLSLLRDEEGRAYGILGVATDITGERAAEEALRESEQRYRCLANSIPHVTYITDTIGRTKLINDHWQRYAGVAAGDSLDLNWADWVHPDDIGLVFALWTKCLGTGEVFEIEYRLRDRNGLYRWHLGRAVPVYDRFRTIAYWVGTCTDIHVLKTAVQAWQESEERFRLASQALQSIVFDWNPQTGEVRSSGDLTRMLGYEADKAVATEAWWEQIVHPADLADSRTYLLRTLPTHQANFETELRLRHADGTWIDVCDRGFIVRDERGTPTRVVGTTHDISSRKRLERELRDANEDLTHFAYAVGHDLRSPLRTIITFSQLLEQDYLKGPTDRGAQLLTSVIEAGRRMNAMTRDLLEVARLAGAVPASREVVALEDVVAIACRNLASEVEETEGFIACEALPVVTGDSGQLVQVMQNLIANSLKYRKPGVAPHVRVSAERGVGEWTIRVLDNGIGFAPQYAEQIFGVFKRLHGAEYSGTGVGLAICKRIVERMGGQIRAAATPGQGAEFSFTIPDVAVE